MQRKLVLGVLLLCALAALYWALHATGALTIITDKGALYEWIVRLGAWGPLIIIVLMILAILISPIPSAPIALAAGAAYGHWWAPRLMQKRSESTCTGARSRACFVAINEFKSKDRSVGPDLVLHDAVTDRPCGPSIPGALS